MEIKNPTENFSSDDFLSLLKTLQQTSDTISNLIEGLSHAELRWKNSDSEFSSLENVCHLRDLEMRGYTPRINRILAEPNPALPDFDGARVAAESNYNCEPLDVAYLAFKSARKQNVEKLKGLTLEQLCREGSLQGVGRITLIRLAELMREHDEGHIEDMRVLRQRLERARENEASPQRGAIPDT